MKRILLADNNIPFLNTCKALLEQAGFDVLKAASLDDARHLLATRHIHLAILDIRLVDDNDEHDLSGLLLAKDPSYHAIPKIILTNYPTYQAVRDALSVEMTGLAPAVGFVGKTEGTETLIAAIDAAFVKNVRINFNLIIDTNKLNPLTFLNLAKLIDSDITDELLLIRALELEDLLRSLFFQKEQIRLDRLLWYRGGRVALIVQAIVHNALDSYVVVLGQSKVTATANERYYSLPTRQTGEPGTTLAGYAETVHFAAHLLTCGTDNLENAVSLHDIYRTDSKRFKATLDTLFQRTLVSWERSLPQLSGRACRSTISQLYKERLSLMEFDLTQVRWADHVQTILAKLEGHSIGIELANTKMIWHLARHDFMYADPSPKLWQPLGEMQPADLILTPGWLTGENILIDTDDQIWLTDFADSGVAPSMWHAISMEAALRFDWVESSDLQQLHEMERRLTSTSASTHDFAILDTQDVEGPIRQALSAIQTVRSYVVGSLDQNCAAYHWGLFFHAAKRVVDFDLTGLATRGELVRVAHVLLAMAMIGDLLDQPSALLPPASTYVGASDIQVDQINREVRVKGRQVNLSPTEYQLLVFLHDRAGTLCEHAAIYEAVFGEKQRYTGTEDQKNILSTNIRRLRQEIEPDPSNPRYLLTVRGAGYKLVLSL